MGILNFGSMNIDYVYKVSHFVKPGETISSEQMSTVGGGKGLNQSIALARCGAQVYHAGKVGFKDGTILLDKLSSSGVDITYIEQYDCPSGHSIIQVDESGQNCIILYGGANNFLTKEQVDKVLSHFGSGDILVLQNEINILGYIIQKSYERGMKIALNPSPISKNIFNLPFEKIAYLFVNEVEARELTGIEDSDGQLEQLSAKFPNSTIILTCGNGGAIVKSNGIIYRHGIYDVPVVDTSAAGDTFTGFFIASVSAKKEIPECLELASKAASICVSQKGTSDSIPSFSEVISANIGLKAC